MQSDEMKRLEELTERLTEVPDSEAPQIPKEWLKARGLQQPSPVETEVCDE